MSDEIAIGIMVMDDGVVRDGGPDAIMWLAGEMGIDVELDTEERGDLQRELGIRNE